MYNNVFNNNICHKRHFIGGNNINTNNKLFKNIEYTIFKSNTGMKLLCVPNDDATIISVGMYIRVGSLDESDNELGIAHFLEHMIFKGTGKYPGNSLVERLDDLGTTWNAETSYEYTNYYIHGLPQFREELITILLDMYFDPKIPDGVVDTERKVILEEYRLGLDSKSRVQFNNLLKLVTVEKNKLYGRPVIGNNESINNITIKDLNRFRQKYNDHYKTLITISGKIDVSDIKNFIEKLIQSTWLDNTFKFTKYNDLEKINQKNFTTDLHLITIKPTLQNRYIYAKTSGLQTHLKLSFPCWKTFSKKNIYLGMFSNILSDRLFKNIRVNNGLIYSINADYFNFDPFGIFSINVSFNFKNMYDVVRMILDELINLYKNGITEHELNKVKNSNLTGMMSDYQNQYTFFGIYTGNVAYNYTIYSPNEIVNIYSNVDIIKIKNDIIHHIINPKQLFINIIGPQKPDKHKMINFFNYFNKQIIVINKLS